MQVLTMSSGAALSYQCLLDTLSTSSCEHGQLTSQVTSTQVYDFQADLVTIQQPPQNSYLVERNFRGFQILGGLQTLWRIVEGTKGSLKQLRISTPSKSPSEIKVSSFLIHQRCPEHRHSIGFPTSQFFFPLLIIVLT